MTASKIARTGECAELLDTLATHREFLRRTTRGITDEQARQRTTASELCLGGLIKHVTDSESYWVDFVRNGPDAMERGADNWPANFQMRVGETLANVLEDYERVARHTEQVVAALPDLDLSHPLPEAPWFESGARWSARRALLHIIAETAQHSGHADIIRESLDGAKTMG